MSRYNRTPAPPIFTVDRPIGHLWTWTVTYKVASSGYVTDCHVEAQRADRGETLVGSASCEVRYNNDMSEILECLATEAMLAACELTLLEGAIHRRIAFVSTGL